MKEKIKNSFIYNKISPKLKNKMLNKYHNIKNDGYGTVEEENYYVNKEIDSDKLKISFVIPQPIIGSGGHRNIYRIVHYLAKNGYDVTCYIDPEGLVDKNHVKTGMEGYHKITDNFFDLECNIVFNVNDIKPCDVLFATHAASAYIVNNNKGKYKLGCYFIQDYEAYFFPMGDNYVIAHNTYKLGLYPITSGPWPLEMLKNNFNIKEGNYFRFPINRDIYYYDKKVKKLDNRIVFFAKPSMPRRCYNLGLQALRIVKEKYPEVEIVLYGEKSDSYNNVPFEFTNLGLVSTINELGDLYRSASIGIAFSTTNPSLVPYEMMACGCAVVDLDFNNSIVSYDSLDNVTLADTTPDAIAESIIELYKNKELRKKKMQNALEFVKIFPTEEEMCKLIEGYILKEYKKVSRGK